jgi:hypothetical protein
MIKFAGGALVVAAAAFIMFPAIIGLAFGLLRIILMIVVAGGACLFIAKATRSLQKRKQSDQSAAIASGNTGDQNL